MQQSQINFERLESRMEEVKLFLLEMLKEKSPEEYEKVLIELKQGEQQNGSV